MRGLLRSAEETARLPKGSFNFLGPGIGRNDLSKRNWNWRQGTWWPR